MKVRNELQEVERGGDIEEVAFSIEGSALAFEVLSAGLYSDRVLAIIRELSANAADAHVEAGKQDVPFVINAPNSLTPVFSIRDFGTGLEPDLVRKLYTRYFKSTKTQNNDVTGCMGLGSKSPFSYVDSFNVVSYWNGKKYAFNAFKNEKRLPSIAFLGEEETTEDNGLEISFPVQRSDHWNFEQKIRQALRYFKHKPTIKGYYNYTFEEPDYMMQTNNFGILGKRGESVVIMGNIGYPITKYDFESTKDNLNPDESKLINWGVHLFVEIGDVEIAASREKLTYSVETRATVKRILGEAVKATKELASKKLKEANTVWEARQLIANVRQGVLGEICQDLSEGEVEWNNQKISNIVNTDDWAARIGSKPGVDYPNIESLSLDPTTRRHRSGSDGTNLQKFTARKFEVSSVSIIFVNDLNRGGYAAARRYLEDSKIKKALMFDCAPDAFIDEVGCRDLLIYVSKLPKPERQKRGSAGRVGTNRTLLQELGSCGFSNAEVDLDEGGIYIETRREKVKRPRFFGSTDYDFVSYGYIEQKINQLRALGFDEPIYGVRPCDLDKIKKSDGEWINFEQLISDTLNENSNLLPEAILGATYSKLDGKVCYLRDLKFDNQSVIKQAIDLYEVCQKAAGTNKISAFRSLNEYANLFTIAPDANIIKKMHQIVEVYPMLKHIGYWGGDDTIADIAKYIKLVDGMQEIQEAEAA